MKAKGDEIPKEIWNNIGLLQQMLLGKTDFRIAERYIFIIPLNLSNIF
jgi:hypothetical protein